MASVNKVIIVGNLGRDPETRYMPSGDAMTTSRSRPRTSGKTRTAASKKSRPNGIALPSSANWPRSPAQYLKKGSQVYVEGSLRTRKYTDKDGVEKYSTDIKAETMQMLGGRQGMGGGASMDDGGYGGGAPPGPGPAPGGAGRRNGPPGFPPGAEFLGYG